MAASRRLAKELAEIRQSLPPQLKNVEADDTNMLFWKAVIIPGESATLYRNGHFNITITYPAEYPFKPPKIKFETAIYHPNIDEKGQICLPLISPENWKPATRTMQILNSLVNLVLNPEPEHPLRADVADEFKHHHERFVKKAEESATKSRKQAASSGY